MTDNRDNGHRHEVIELVSYADNDSDLHRTSRGPVVVNLNKKIASGTYDSTKAKKLWRYHADRAAQKHTKGFGGTGHGSYGMFSPAMREAAAKQFADEYEDTVREEGSVPAHLKKHQKEYGEEVPVDANLRPVSAAKRSNRTRKYLLRGPGGLPAWVHYNDNEEPMYEVWDEDPRDATYINTNSPEEHGKHYRLVKTSYDRAAAQMEYEGEFVRSHETGDEVSYKEHQQYQKRGTWQKGNYARSPASRSRSGNGPGPGWHGEPQRHAEAARMGHRRRH